MQMQFQIPTQTQRVSQTQHPIRTQRPSQTHLQPRPHTPRPDTYYLFANVRDEPHILEWAIHHLLIGFTCVFIYDHMSIIPVQTRVDEYRSQHPEYVDLLQRIYVRPIHTWRGLPFIGGKSVKLHLMEVARIISVRNRATWMMYLDADEFLAFNSATFPHSTLSSIPQLHQLTSQCRYADVIAINWVMFGTSGYNEQPDGLLMASFTKSASTINQHVKALSRPQYISTPTNPHFYPALRPTKCISAITRQPCPSSPFCKIHVHTREASVYLAHYYVQSIAEFARRKGRPHDDGTAAVPVSGLGQLQDMHAEDNDYPNLMLAAQYCGRLQQMGLS